MPKLPAAGAELQLDTSKFDAGFKGAIADAAKLDAAISDLGGTVDLKLNVDDSEITTALTSLTQLEDDASVKINIDDGEIQSSLLVLDDLGEDQSVTITSDDSDIKQDLAQIQSTLETIQNISIINLALNVPAQALDFVNKIPGVMALLEKGGAENVLAAALPGQNLAAEVDAATDVFTQGFGESRAEVARFIAMLSNVGVAEQDLDNVAIALFETQTAIEGITGDAPGMEELLRLAQDLVGADIAGSFTEAADIMVAMEQSGIGVGQDALGDANEFVSVMGGMQFTSQQLLDTFNSGLSGGVDTISRMSEAIISFNENATQGTDDLKTSLENLDEVVGTDLSQMLVDFQAGEVTGADFMASVLDGARTFAETQGESQTQTLLQGVFGSTVSNIGSAILDIDPNAGGFTDLEGRSKTAAEAIRDDWQTTFEELKRTIDEELGTLLDDTLDISGRLDTAKGQFQTFVDELQSGTGLGDAIEIAFGIPGVDDALMNIQRIFGQMMLSALEVVAFIQDPLGTNDNDKGTRAEIARLAEGQLAFDLQVVNPDEVSGVVTQAIARGVSDEDAKAAVVTALDELFASGDFAGAVDLMQGLADTALAEGGDSAVATQALMDQYAGQLQSAFDTAIATQDFDVAKKIADAQGQSVDFEDKMKQIFGFDAAAFDTMIADSMTAMTAAIETETATPFEAWAVQAQDWANQGEKIDATTQLITDAQSAVAAFEATPETLGAAAEAATFMDSDMATAFTNIMANATEADLVVDNALTGNTMTASFEEVGVGASLMAVMVGKAMRKIREDAMLADAVLTGIAAKVTAVNQAVAGAQTAANGGGGGGGTVNNTNINVNNTNNVQSTAQAAANGYALGESVRGMS